MQSYDSLDQPGAVEGVAALLRQGGVVVLPTDTLYGFSAALNSETAYQRIVEIKKDRVGSRKYLTLASSLDMVERFVASWGCVNRDEMAAVWPAPLTAIFTSRASACPDWIGETIAVRVPNVTPLRDIIDAAGEPVISTSVNLSGAEPMRNGKAILEAFGADIDGFVAGDEFLGAWPPPSLPRATEGASAPPSSPRNTPGPGGASTLVDFTGKQPVVLRRGSYVWGS